jgi:hypothetical protein
MALCVIEFRGIFHHEGEDIFDRDLQTRSGAKFLAKNLRPQFSKLFALHQSAAEKTRFHFLVKNFTKSKVFLQATRRMKNGRRRARLFPPNFNLKFQHFSIGIKGRAKELA